MTRDPLLTRPTRRAALAGALGFGVSLSLLARPAWSDTAAGERRLVVIICRGGMDGLSVSPPVGDPSYAGLRGPIAIAPFGAPGGALRLDETFGLHPALAQVHQLASGGQVRIAPAIATSDRERSHFEAQDVLESGAAVVYGTSSGWLNRAIVAMAEPRRPKALSLGPTTPLVLRGQAATESWAPGGLASRDPRLAGILQDLYAGDPMLSFALANGIATQSLALSAKEVGAKVLAGGPAAVDPSVTGGGERKQAPAQSRQLGATLAGFMVQPQGPRVAALELDGFDTHALQGTVNGQLAARLLALDAFIDGLATGLGPAWSDTVVLVATEFGRTARVNGTAGTDHGTASTALLLGGAIRKGGIIGDWPTLAQARLFENRDTAPTLDMRALFKGVLRDHLGLDRAALDRVVFPDSTRVAPARQPDRVSWSLPSSPPLGGRLARGEPALQLGGDLRANRTDPAGPGPPRTRTAPAPPRTPDSPARSRPPRRRRGSASQGGARAAAASAPRPAGAMPPWNTSRSPRIGWPMASR